MSSPVRHFTATAIVIDDTDRVLLVHHRKAGKWLPPGGHVDPNEAPAEAAVREVAEETGIHARVLHPPLFTHPAVTSHPTPWAIIEMDVEDRRHGPHRHIDLVYVCRATGGQLTAQLAEVGDARWVALGDVPALPIPGELPELIDAALRWAKEYA